MWLQDIRKFPKDDSPTHETNQAIMGQERLIAVFEIVKTKSLGFLNDHEMFMVPLAKSKVAPVAIANHTALIQARKESRSPQDFDKYMRIVNWFKKHNAFVVWPKDVKVQR